MKNAFAKNLLREIKNTKARFISILVIVTIGVAFFAGVRATSPDMLLTGNKYLHDYAIADLRVLSMKGFTYKDIEKIKGIKGVEEALTGYNFDAFAVKGEEEKPVKINSYKIGGQSVNKPVLIEGKLPTSEEECVTEIHFLDSVNLKIGDSIELKTTRATKSFKIVGTVHNPMYINTYERGNNTLGNGQTAAFFQIGEKASSELALLKTPGELYVTVTGAKDKNIFLDEYRNLVTPVKEKIKAGSSYIVLDTNDNEGVSGFKSNSDRIGAIGKVFPLFFFLIATLVCLTTMTRMVEEQRTQIGTLKALGYGKLTIISQYFLYSFLASIGGSIIGTLAGFKLFPTIIFNAYRIMYSLPPVESPFNVSLAISSTLVAVLCTTIAAIFSALKELIAVPAVLMKPKAPMTGQRIFMESIGFLWKRMSFIRKVTARNIFRYKKRFFMTVIGIAGCTALLLTGFGLKDSILSITDKQFNEIYEYNMIAYLNKPVQGDEISKFKEVLKSYKEIDSSLILLQQSTTVTKASNDKGFGSVYLTVPEDASALDKFIHLKEKGNTISIPENGVVVTEKLSKLLSIKTGDNISINLAGKVVKAKVAGITEHYTGHYVYMTPKYYESLFNEKVKYNGFASIINNTGKSAEDSLSLELMKNKTINSVNFTTSISGNFQKSMKGMDSVIWVLIISAAALAFVVMFNLTSININERIRELATIKVLGFYDIEVAEYIFRENMVLSVVGTLVGLVLGLGLHRYVVITSEIEIIMFVRAIKPLSFVYASVLTVIFAGLVNVVMYDRIKKIDMVESLKSGE